MRNIVTGLTLTAALVGLPGCGDDDATSSAEMTVPARSDWDPAALTRARAVADRTIGTAEGCVDERHQVHEWAAFADSYQMGGLPLPAASIECETQDERNLFVEVFDGADDKDAFVAAKQRLLCERGRAVADGTDEAFAIPYVDGGDWIIEPDSAEMAEALAGVTGGTAGDMCA
jgi:hypothetical protein